MASRLALAVSMLALVIAVVALAVAVSDTADTATSAISDAADLVESLETLSTDSLESAGAVTVITTPAPEEPATEVPAAVGDAPSEDASSTGEAAGEDPPEPAPSTVTAPLPGEPYDVGPTQGASLAVVGVDHDDVLNVRDVPAGEIIATLDYLNPIVGLVDVRDSRGEIVASLYSWEGGIVATGRTRKLPTTVWHEVHVAGMTGWASGAYLAHVGLTDDATAEIIGILGETPVADTMFDLGLRVARAMATEEPPSGVVVSVAPNVFEGLADMTVDIVNIGDDSLFGFRLDIFAHPAEDWMQEDPGPYTLKNVERTVLCYSHRGVTEEGLCL